MMRDLRRSPFDVWTPVDPAQAHAPGSWIRVIHKERPVEGILWMTAHPTDESRFWQFFSWLRGYTSLNDTPVTPDLMDAGIDGGRPWTIERAGTFKPLSATGFPPSFREPQSFTRFAHDLHTFLRSAAASGARGIGLDRSQLFFDERGQPCLFGIAPRRFEVPTCDEATAAPVGIAEQARQDRVALDEFIADLDVPHRLCSTSRTWAPSNEPGPAYVDDPLYQRVWKAGQDVCDKQDVRGVLICGADHPDRTARIAQVTADLHARLGMDVMHAHHCSMGEATSGMLEALRRRYGRPPSTQVAFGTDPRCSSEFLEGFETVLAGNANHDKQYNTILCRLQSHAYRRPLVLVLHGFVWDSDASDHANSLLMESKGSILLLLVARPSELEEHASSLPWLNWVPHLEHITLARPCDPASDAEQAQLERCCLGGATTLKALQIGSLLGINVSTSEWLSACKAMGIAVPWRDLERLCYAGLVRESDGSGINGGGPDWRFSETSAREDIRCNLQHSDLWASTNRACADAVPPLPGQRIRSAFFLLESGEVETAVEILLQGLQTTLDRRHRRELEPVLDELEKGIELLDLPPSDPHRGATMLARARIRHTESDLRLGERRWTELRIQADRYGWTEAQVVARIHEAQLHLWYGESQEATRCIEEALQRANDPELYAEAASRATIVFLGGGNQERAKDLAQTAYKFFKGTDRHQVLTRALVGLAACDLYAGNSQEAMQHAKEALQHGELSGDSLALGRAHNTMGEIYRFDGHLEEAEAAYVAACDMFTHTGSMFTPIPTFNLALTVLEMNRPEEALEMMRVNLATAQLRNIGDMYMGLVTASIACLAKIGNTDDFDGEISAFKKNNPNFSPRNPDEQHMLAMAAECWEERGDHDRARVVRSLLTSVPYAERRPGSQHPTSEPAPGRS